MAWRGVAVGTALAALACSGLVQPIEHAATDGSATVKVPASWEAMELNDEAVVELGNPFQEAYLVVIAERNDDLSSDLQSYSDRMRAFERDSLLGVSETGPTATTVDGRPAIEYVMTGTTNGQPMTMIHTVVDGQWSRFQILAWTLTSRWDLREPTLRDVVASLHETRPVRAPAPASAGDPIRLPSADGRVRVELPPGWSAATGLSDVADLQARDTEGAAFLLVISEPAEDLTLGLQTYGERSRAAMMSGWDAGTATDPVATEIGGRPAVTSILRGEYDGARVVAVHTVLRGEHQFHQVMAWTVPSRWEEERDVLSRFASTIEEVEPTP